MEMPFEEALDWTRKPAEKTPVVVRIWWSGRARPGNGLRRDGQDRARSRDPGVGLPGQAAYERHRRTERREPYMGNHIRLIQSAALSRTTVCFLVDNAKGERK
jgi:hypothetical protein